ncbi:MAG: 50S ribosomal protein L18, partial [Candidatus Omnitrophota bacterium]|nr:50S ribosomal protein L18 [Candidatus Omnitrophota bacterium]
RHRRVRKKIAGNKETLRLSVHRSHLNLYTQLINDVENITVLSVSTRDKKFKEKSPQGGNIKAAKLLGQILAEKAKLKGINKVVFDRGGYIYHGRIKALAESIRAGGINC